MLNKYKQLCMTDCYKIINTIYGIVIEARDFVIWTGYFQD